MSRYNAHKEMILMVAKALGDELLPQVAFVGGCTTGLLITDEMTKESVRYTDDVDLIISVMGYTGWHKFSEQLVDRGFRISMDDEVNCRFRLGDLQVDFMPDDEGALGFTNRWYKAALQTAQSYSIAEGINIRLVAPVYFLATKFEAFKGRGQNDLLGSRDIEDILNLIDGREELNQELQEAAADVKDYLVAEFKMLLSSPDINYAVQSTASGDVGRESLIFMRMEAVVIRCDKA
jgi:predicted nucleotidyltransferase